MWRMLSYYSRYRVTAVSEGTLEYGAAGTSWNTTGRKVGDAPGSGLIRGTYPEPFQNTKPAMQARRPRTFPGCSAAGAGAPTCQAGNPKRAAPLKACKSTMVREPYRRHGRWPSATQAEGP
eukprot:356586-Chlamydomonas_euryale.AAC.5